MLERHQGLPPPDKYSQDEAAPMSVGEGNVSAEEDPLSYRPITDVWHLARPKLGGKSYYGAYPSGFLERACYLLGVNPWSRVLHVCGGALRDYHSGPTKGLGLGVHHKTIDLNQDLRPDFLFDVNRLGVEEGDFFPSFDGERCEIVEPEASMPLNPTHFWDAALIDRPYSPEDHEHYENSFVKPDDFPDSLNSLLKRALSVVRPGGRVGVLDYLWPMPPSKQKHLPRPPGWEPAGDEADKPAARLIATVQVLMGWNNRCRIYSVYERLPTEREYAHFDELHVNAICEVSGVSELEDKVEQHKAEIEELKTKLEEYSNEEEVADAVDEALAEQLVNAVEPLVEWALDAGAHPDDVPLGARDIVRKLLEHRAGYIWPGQGRLPQPDRAAVVKAAATILERSAPDNGAGHVSSQDPATGVPFTPAGRAERHEPAPTPTEAEEGYREVFQALTTPTEAPTSPPADDPAMDGFV